MSTMSTMSKTRALKHLSAAAHRFTSIERRHLKDDLCMHTTLPCPLRAAEMELRQAARDWYFISNAFQRRRLLAALRAERKLKYQEG